MKIFKAIILAAALLSLPVYSHAQSLGAMRTSLIEGDVQIKIQETGEWAPVAVNTPLMEGDQIWVPDGARAELQLSTNTYIRLDQNSALQILRMEQDAPQFYVSQGHAYIYYNAPRRGIIQVDTPAASIRSYESSVFRIDIPDEFTDVSVFKGSVDAENNVGRIRVPADNTLSLGTDTNAELAPMGPPDDWELWNKERNRRVFARKVSNQYLPEELRPYAYDFDSGGRWVNVPDYGNCWTPTVEIAVGWTPYRHGRWIWAGGDYVWVSYESWGWAPYHYGRWAFVGRVGWCWVPPVRGEVFWAPGYVAWVTTGDYVAWVPLAPRELYYGHGYYGPHSVNITNINIQQVNVTNVYKNVNVANSITVMNKNTFISGRPAVVNPSVITDIKQNMFLTRKINVAGPQIKPTAASYVPLVKSIHPAKLPPRAVRSLEVKELRQTRPLIKEQNKSVFNPKVQPRELTVKKVETSRSLPERMKQRQQLQPAVKGKAVPPATLEERKGKREKTIVVPEGKGAPAAGPEVREKRKEKIIVPEGKGGPAAGPEVREKRKEKIVVPEGKGGPAAGPEVREKRKEKIIVPEGKGGPAAGPEVREKRKEKIVVPEGKGGPAAGPEVRERRKEKIIVPEGKGGPAAGPDVQEKRKEKIIVPEGKGAPVGQKENKQKSTEEQQQKENK